MLKSCAVFWFIGACLFATMIVVVVSTATGTSKKDTAVTLGGKVYHSFSRSDKLPSYKNDVYENHESNKNTKSTHSTTSNNVKHKSTLPVHAVEVSHNIYYLGKSKLKARSEESLSTKSKGSKYTKPVQDTEYHGYAMIHSYEQSNTKKNGRGRTVTTNATSSDCFGMLADGAVWKNLESWSIDTTNTQGLSDSFIREVWSKVQSDWKGVCSGFYIGAENTSQTVDGIDLNAPDGKNEIMLGNIDPDTTVGMTVVWGIFDGPVTDRKIFEADMILNDVDYSLGNALVNSNVMDLEGLMKHEFGHWLGAADIYLSYCNGVIMYGRTSKGSVAQRTIDELTGDSLCNQYSIYAHNGLGSPIPPPNQGVSGNGNSLTQKLLIALAMISLTCLFV